MFYKKVWDPPDNLPKTQVAMRLIFKVSYYVAFDYWPDLYHKGQIRVQIKDPLIFHWVVGKN